MRTKLIQRHGLLRRTYLCVEDGIRVSERSLTRGRTLTVPYELMFGDREEVFTASRYSLIAALMMAAIAVICVFAESERYAWVLWGTFAALAGSYYWASRRDQVGFVDGKAAIFFLRDRPSPEAVDEFLADARERAREKIRTRILPLRSTDDPGADLERAAWLRDRAVITNEEYTNFARDLAPIGTPAGPNNRVQN